MFFSLSLSHFTGSSIWPGLYERLAPQLRRRRRRKLLAPPPAGFDRSQPDWWRRHGWGVYLPLNGGFISPQDTRIATAHSIHLHSPHRAVIFAIAQLSCWRSYSARCELGVHYTLCLKQESLANAIRQARDSSACMKLPRNLRQINARNIISKSTFNGLQRYYRLRVRLAVAAKSAKFSENLNL